MRIQMLNCFKILFLLVVFQVLLPKIVFAQADEPWKGAYTSPEFAGGAIRDVYCDLVREVEGSFGALGFIVAGLATFGYAVFGDSKKVLAAIMAGLVAASMSTGISLYFGQMCGAQGGGDGNARVVTFDEDVTNNAKRLQGEDYQGSDDQNIEESVF